MHADKDANKLLIVELDDRYELSTILFPPLDVNSASCNNTGDCRLTQNGTGCINSGTCFV